MTNLNIKTSLVIICFRTIIDFIKSSISMSLPDKYFDDEELTGIAKDIIVNAYNDIFNICSLSGSLNDDHDKADVYQQSIDYLMYCGLDQDTAFRLTHHSESLILHAILDVVPDIDDTNKYTIINMTLKHNDFVISIRIKRDHESYNFNSINLSNVW